MPHEECQFGSRLGYAVGGVLLQSKKRGAQAFYTEGTACRRAAAPCLCGGFAQRAQERKPLDF